MFTLAFPMRFWNDLRLHYTTEMQVTWPFMQVQP